MTKRWCFKMCREMYLNGNQGTWTFTSQEETCRYMKAKIRDDGAHNAQYFISVSQ